MVKQRSISAIPVVLAMAIPAFIGGPVFAVAVLLLGILGLHELLRALTTGGIRPFRTIAFVSLVAIISAAAVNAPAPMTIGVVITAVLVMLAAGIFRQSSTHSLTDWALTLGTTLYVALPLAHAIALRGIEGVAARVWVRDVVKALGSEETSVGLAWLGLAITVTWLTDVSAYIVGRQFGRVKLIPHLSPGKTRVGAVAGLVAGVVSGGLVSILFGVPIPWYGGAAVGLILAVLAQVGDLSESLIKRSLGIKDMSNLIPGHGGVLDRIDALLFTLPATYYLVQLLQEGGWL